MARVPEAELERLKREIPLEKLALAKGIQLVRHGADLLGLCPFHDDHEPSLVITPDKNLWHCLGACQAGGSVIDWVMRSEGVNFRHAVELLKTDPSLAAGQSPLVRHSTVKRLPPPVDFDAEDRELMHQVTAYYHQTLLDSPEALNYLESRGIGSQEAIELFQLGFANRTLGLRLPDKNRKAGADIRGRLQKLGLYRDTGHEHFNGSLVIPIWDSGGDVVEMYGRKITDNLRAGTPLHLYLPGPHQGVWNSQGIGEEVILCEAPIDALTFWVNGFRNVTTSYGIEGFTQEHLDTFRAQKVARVYIAYDRDTAGDRAATELATKLMEVGIDVYRVQFPNGEDANSFACQEMSTAKERLAHAIATAIWLGNGKRENGAAKEEEQITLPLVANTVPSQSVEPSGDEVILAMGERSWRIRGLDQLTQSHELKLNLLLRKEDLFFVDTVDLYIAKQRAAYAVAAAQETGVLEDTVRRDLGRVLLSVEEIQAQRASKSTELPKTELSEEEKEAALTVLRDPNLLDQVLLAFDKTGVVGEETNKLVAYLAATSRLLDQPLAVVIQSSSAAGKSQLMEAVLQLLPEQARVKYSAMTGQSLYYMAEQELCHKVLAVVEEAGAEKASYALKLLQSEGELAIASTGKDPKTGRLITHDYHVHGPVALMLTTTSVDVDEELLNRCLVLAVDEEREQTRAIHARQREKETLAGLLAEEDRKQVVKLMRNVQALLRPLKVINPYANELTFADLRTRSRRDHQKYLTLIRTIALLFQYQREVKRASTASGELEYIEVEPSDIAIANRLAAQVLARSNDELPPQTRRVLDCLTELVAKRMTEQALSREEVRITRKEAREATGVGNTRLGIHLSRLVELEYLLQHHLPRSRSIAYELVLDASQEGEVCLTDYNESTHPEVANTPHVLPINAPFTQALPTPEIEQDSASHKGILSLAARFREIAVTGRRAQEAVVTADAK